MKEEGAIAGGKKCGKGPEIIAPVKRKLFAAKKKKLKKTKRSKKVHAAAENSGAQSTQTDSGDKVEQKSAPQRPKATGFVQTHTYIILTMRAETSVMSSLIRGKFCV